MNNCEQLLTRYEEAISLVKDILEWHTIAIQGVDMSLEKKIELYDKLHSDEWEERQKELTYSNAWWKESADCFFVRIYLEYLEADDEEFEDCGSFEDTLGHLVTNSQLLEWLNKVTENNWSKFVPLDKDLLCWPSELGHSVLSEEAKQIEQNSKGRYKEVTYEVVDTKCKGEVMLFRDQSSKVLKPLNFRELEY